MDTCSRPDCDRSVIAKGLCASHYQTQRLATQRASARAESRPCLQCGRDLAGKRPNARFCDSACKEASYSAANQAVVAAKRVGRTCVWCKGPLGATQSGKAQTCSLKCRNDWQNSKRDTQRQVEWDARKQPCPACGKDIPSDRKRGTIYCSEPCRRKVLSARWRERSPGYMRQYHYGISPEDFDALLASQEGRCPICGSDVHRAKGWHLDHDHVTGKVRGILCGPCNNGLGNFNDDPARLRAAAEYLE